MAPVHVQQDSDCSAWDDYVDRHPEGLVYHRSGLCDVIERVYGHRVYRLAAHAAAKAEPRDSSNPGPPGGQPGRIAPPSPGGDVCGASRCGGGAGAITGILPLVHIRHPLFGNSLVSMPFFDRGGIAADDPDAELALAAAAWGLADRLGCRQVELRGAPGAIGNGGEDASPDRAFTVQTRSPKVRMVLALPESAETLMGSFKSKLRSQLNKPIRDGLSATVGADELVDDFYRVFAENMRDLGSPVHAKRFVAEFVRQFPGQSNIFLVYKNRTPVAGAVAVGFRDTLVNPWASSLRAFNRSSPNMLLYWSMLKHACDCGFRYFDFGRSTPGEGTFKFKAQWGAEPWPLPWCYLSAAGQAPDPGSIRDNSAFGLAGRLWSHLPVAATRVIGPRIRKYIGL